MVVASDRRAGHNRRGRMNAEDRRASTGTRESWRTRPTVLRLLERNEGDFSEPLQDFARFPMPGEIREEDLRPIPIEDDHRVVPQRGSGLVAQGILTPRGTPAIE